MKTLLSFVAVLALVAIMGTLGSVQAQGPGGPGGRGSSPSFDKLLDAFDANDDGALEEDEVPARVWARLSQADANGDGVVTRAEFDAYRKKLTGGK